MNSMLLLAHAGEGGWFPHGPSPLHPILVNFTAALVPASLFSDVLGRLLRRQSLTAAGWWMLLYAAAITPFTALAGWLWLRRMGGMDMPPMTIHKWLGTALAVLFLPLVLWRWRIQRRSHGAPSWLYLACAAVVVGALTLQGHFGGKMSFDTSGEITGERQGQAHPAAGTSQDNHGTEWRDHIDVKD
jgi:uncharacterized membrane protein